MNFIKQLPLIIGIVCLQAKNRGIGYAGNLLHKCSEDMAFFSQKTKEGKKPAVIMGHRTWFSVPKKYLPMKDRTNFVVSREWLSIMGDYTKHGIYGFENPQKALDFAKQYHDRIYICGGQPIYTELLSQCDILFVTEIQAELEADTFFPEFKNQFDFVKEIKKGFCDDGETPYTINLYRNRKYHGEGEE